MLRVATDSVSDISAKLVALVSTAIVSRTEKILVVEAQELLKTWRVSSTDC